MKPIKIAVIGTGFWANYQVPAWLELEGVEIVALYNRTAGKAFPLAERYNIPGVYDDAEKMLHETRPDVVDIITDVDTHHLFTSMAANNGVNVICQKPMAASEELARDMLDVCRTNNVKLFIHENFRWQKPVRAVKDVLNSLEIGRPFRARVSFCSAFPVFDNQPALAEVPHFILSDIGSHIFDICRFLFGEATSLYCITKTVNKKIKGEDVANVMMEMEDGVQCFAEMSYASILQKESFPQTFVSVEGELGSIHLTHDFKIITVTRGGAREVIVKPDEYPWADPDYMLVHSSIVDCNENILQGLSGGECETTGEDNFRTVQLVWAAYASAAQKRPVFF